MNLSELASVEQIRKEHIKNFVQFLISRMPENQIKIKRSMAQYLKGVAK